MGYAAQGPPASSCRRAQPRVPLLRPCSPTRDLVRPTAHATSSRQEPAMLTGPRPCYSSHVMPQALPPSADRAFRPPEATPSRACCCGLATLVGAPPPLHLLLRSLRVFVDSEEQVVGDGSGSLPELCSERASGNSLQKEPNSNLIYALVLWSLNSYVRVCQRFHHFHYILTICLILHFIFVCVHTHQAPLEVI